MTVALRPYAEKTVSDWLRSQVDVRVVGKTPSSVAESWVRVTQLDATSDHRSDHLVKFYFQLDVYASADGGQPEANLLSRQIRKALMEMPGVHDDAVVSGVDIRADARIPDTDFEPARERFILRAAIWAHAVSA